MLFRSFFDIFSIFFFDVLSFYIMSFLYFCFSMFCRSMFCHRPHLTYRVKSSKFGHQVNSDTRLQTVKIQMRRLLMSRLIRIFTVCLFNSFFIPIFEILNKQGRCPNLAVCPNIPDFTLSARQRRQLNE